MKKILIIDDDKGQRDILSKLLSLLNCQILEARDGQEGLAMFEEHKPDLVITDIYMPNRDGLEIIGEMRRMDPQIKIIAISGGHKNLRLDVLSIAKQMGVAKTFEKPFNLKPFLYSVQDLLEI